jgi:hypothetical protein
VGGERTESWRACELARAKKLRALEPCDSGALFKLCREVFEAPRLNLATLYSSLLGLARGFDMTSCAYLCIAVQNKEGGQGSSGGGGRGEEPGSKDEEDSPQ